MLDCMATYRCMDKKPYDNILKDLSITRFLPNGIIADALKGGVNMKSEVLINRPASEFIGIKNAGSIEDSGFASTATLTANDTVASNVNLSSVSAIMAVRKKGKHFAPLPGNWHRIIGLIQ